MSSMALDNLRRKYKDLEDILSFLEEASESFDRIKSGKHSSREAENIEEAVKEALEDDIEDIYVREADVTLSRRPLEGSEKIVELIDKIERELGGGDPIEMVIAELKQRISILCSDPERLRKLSPESLAALLHILRFITESENL